jgi:acyl-coenzyme A synthetase/AMP-(fatty) acid ligase
MKDNCIRCALWMQKQGIKSGDVIGLSTHNQLDAYIPFFATFFVGAILNPWYHEHTLSKAIIFSLYI